MKINFKIRTRDPLFWVQLGAMVLGVFSQAIAGNLQDITTWGKLGEVLLGIISNPYVLGCFIYNLVIGVINLLRDPTTSGLSDSARAQSYESVNDSDVSFGIEIASVEDEIIDGGIVNEEGE